MPGQRPVGPVEDVDQAGQRAGLVRHLDLLRSCGPQPGKVLRSGGNLWTHNGAKPFLEHTDDGA
jgi:hypothetical protein